MKLFSQPTVQNIWLALVLVFSGIIYAQTPGIPYQAYIEDTNAGYVPGEQLKNIPLSHTTVLLQFEVRNDKDVIEYSEEISRPTDKYGMLSTVIGVGNGTVTYRDFQNIRWDGTKKTLRTNIDFSNTGNNFEYHGEIVLYYIPNPSGGGGILATNGLTVDANNTVQLGGALIQPTAIDTDATNSLAIKGLEDADITANDFDVMVVNQTTGVLQKLGTENLRARQYVLEYTAARGDDEFDTPQEIIELENVDAYRNGVRIDFVQVDADTVKLHLAETGGCYADDQIRIVQLQ